VLGGGGAKGAAHIGVLRVLDELHVPIDCVVGTSMGALVGAVFASGAPAAEVERAMLAIDWARTVGGEGQRDRTPINRKLTSQTYTNGLEVGVRNRQLRMPGGLVDTQEIEQMIRTLVASARSTQRFDDLPIPYRAVATDMLTGQMVVLGSGDLSVAMRASMAMPGVFSPVTIDGRVLSDGGMTRNLPVDVARELCADVVVAVWVSSPPQDAEGLESAVSVLQRSVNVMIEANERVQIASLSATDVGIDVPTGDIGASDFERVPEAVELGRAAAIAQSDALRRYAVPAEEYRAWADSRARSASNAPTLADVRIVGTDRVNPDFVRAQLEDVRPGAAPRLDEIVTDVERVHALGDFERVEYALTGPEDQRVLEITPVEKSWGPDFFRFDLGLSTYEGGDIFAILRVDHNRTWMNSRGGQWHNAAQLGRQSLLTTDFYQPLDATRQRFFVQPIALAREDIEDVYLDGDRAARYSLRELFGQVDLGVNFGTRAQLRLGLRSGDHEAQLDTGPPSLPELERTPDTSIQLRAVYDTRDSIALPTRGTWWSARYVSSTDWLGGEEDYSILESVFVKSFEVHNDNSLTVMLGGADTLDGELPITQQIKIGGIRTFPGLRPGELRGNSYWVAGARYSWRLLDLRPVFGEALYAGLRFQAGDVGERFDGAPAETLYGLAGSIGGRTPVGPFLFSLGFVDNGSWQLQFTLGRPVAEGSLLDEAQ
jgi:NTE family protein